MFGIGGWEIVLVLAMTLIFLGPKRLPEIAKVLGRIMGSAKRVSEDLRDEMAREMRAESDEDMIDRAPEKNLSGHDTGDSTEKVKDPYTSSDKSCGDYKQGSGDDGSEK